MANFDRNEYRAGRRPGGVVGWAARRALFWGIIALVAYSGISHRKALLPHGDAPATPVAAGAPAPPNSLVFRADKLGHVHLEADVDGVPVRFVVDTGATLVALTLRDAEAAGISPGDLAYDQPVNTANGAARVARVTLRELRLGQFSAYDVPAWVQPRLGQSLLGMSFLNRLESYEMRDGVLTMNW